MISKIFAVHDSKAEAYLSPMTYTTKGMAIRAFTEVANDPKSNICRYPEDYTLFELGEYDDSNGQIRTLSTPVAVGKAIEFRKESSVLPDGRPVQLDKYPPLHS